MNAATESELRRIFADSKGGVVGLVDHLLVSCPAQGLELRWQDDHCEIRSLEDRTDHLEWRVKKSVYRALLARVANLSGQGDESASPYGGSGELVIGEAPPIRFRVMFENTPGEQNLRIVPFSTPYDTQDGR